MRHIAHVPMPFSVGGSSIATVVQALCDQHAVRGGRSSVVVTQGRDLAVDGARNIPVNYRERCPREWFTRRELVVDFVAGRVGRERPHYGRLQIPATAALAYLRPDAVLVHEGHYAAASLPRWSRSLPGSAVVLYVHNELSRSYSTKELRRLLRQAQGVVFVSGEARLRVVRRHGDLPVPSVVVPNGVDLHLFHPPGGPEPRSAGLRVSYVGQVAPHKGVHLMLEALARCGVASPSVRVVGSAAYGGQGPLSEYERSLRSLANRLGLSVEFIPFLPRPAVADVMRRSDVVCVPSLAAESFGMVALEAMASGAAVIAADQGGLPEACGGAATLVDPRNVDAFAAAVRRHDDPAFLEGQKSRSRARAASAGWSVSYDRLVDALDSWR